MNKLALIPCLVLIAVGIGCSSNTAPNAAAVGPNSNTATTKPATTGSATDSPSAVVKAVYDHAIKRNCDAIPPLLAPEFRKDVGTSKDMLDALCDSIAGQVTSIEVKSEDVKGDSATVKTTVTMKDGKKEDKEDRVKKVDGKWLLDS